MGSMGKRQGEMKVIIPSRKTIRYCMAQPLLFRREVGEGKMGWRKWFIVASFPGTDQPVIVSSIPELSSPFRDEITLPQKVRAP